MEKTTDDTTKDSFEQRLTDAINLVQKGTVKLKDDKGLTALRELANGANTDQIDSMLTAITNAFEPQSRLFRISNPDPSQSVHGQTETDLLSDLISQVKKTANNPLVL